jgi:octaprenyl-diphosphate synthase
MQAIENRNPRIAALVDHVSRYRGKRLRPALLLLSGRACGEITPAHHTLAAVLELIHTATLVHDDILDGASVRRHMATVNAEWGVSSGILLGDYLFTHAFHLVAALDDAESCRYISLATNRTCEGELCQGLHGGNLELTEDEYLEMIEGKTAELISCCCRLGALRSGAPGEVVEGLARYGRWLGLAFQIADDLLDLVGEEWITGKSLGTDIVQKKLTLPLIRLLEQVEPAQAVRLRQILAGSGNHKRELLRPFLEESDALAYSTRRARDFAASAQRELQILPPSACRDSLEVLTEKVVQRSR